MEGRCAVVAIDKSDYGKVAPFNKNKSKRAVFIANERDFGEGVNFAGQVRRIVLASPPLTYNEYIQREGRILRVCAHSSMKKPEIEVQVLVAVDGGETECVCGIPKKVRGKTIEKTADEEAWRRVLEQEVVSKEEMKYLRDMSLDASIYEKTSTQKPKKSKKSKKVATETDDTETDGETSDEEDSSIKETL